MIIFDRSRVVFDDGFQTTAAKIFEFNDRDTARRIAPEEVNGLEDKVYTIGNIAYVEFPSHLAFARCKDCGSFFRIVDDVDIAEENRYCATCAPNHGLFWCNYHSAYEPLENKFDGRTSTHGRNFCNEAVDAIRAAGDEGLLLGGSRYYICAECGGITDDDCVRTFYNDGVQAHICSNCVDDGLYVYCDYHRGYERACDHEYHETDGTQEYGYHDRLYICREAAEELGLHLCDECGEHWTIMEHSCRECGRKFVDMLMNNYSYKPTPVFRRASTEPVGNKLGVYTFYGVELEQSGGDLCYFAKKWHEKYDCDKDAFYWKHDGSLSSDSGVELVSHPFTYDAWKEQDFTENIFRMLNEASYEEDSCAGMHVHISRKQLGENQTERYRVGMRIALLMGRFQEQLTTLSDRDWDNLNEWAEFPSMQFRKNDRTEDEWYKWIEDKFSGTRYIAFNLENSNTYEIRIFACCCDQETFMFRMNLVNTLVEAAKHMSLREAMDCKWCDLEQYWDADNGFFPVPECNSYNNGVNFAKAIIIGADPVLGNAPVIAESDVDFDWESWESASSMDTEDCEIDCYDVDTANRIYNTVIYSDINSGWKALFWMNGDISFIPTATLNTLHINMRPGDLVYCNGGNDSYGYCRDEINGDVGIYVAMHDTYRNRSVSYPIVTAAWPALGMNATHGHDCGGALSTNCGQYVPGNALCPVLNIGQTTDLFGADVTFDLLTRFIPMIQATGYSINEELLEVYEARRNMN